MLLYFEKKLFFNFFHFVPWAIDKLMKKPFCPCSQSTTPSATKLATDLRPVLLTFLGNILLFQEDPLVRVAGAGLKCFVHQLPILNAFLGRY